jgi:hypothetical protein
MAASDFFAPSEAGSESPGLFTESNHLWTGKRRNRRHYADVCRHGLSFLSLFGQDPYQSKITVLLP